MQLPVFRTRAENFPHSEINRNLTLTQSVKKHTICKIPNTVNNKNSNAETFPKNNTLILGVTQYYKMPGHRKSQKYKNKQVTPQL